MYVSRRSDGTFVTVHRDGAPLLVFHPDGTMLREVGQRGSGPGEFLRIRRVLIGQGDSLIVSDWGNGRLTFVDESLNVVRTMPSTLLPNLALHDGRMLMAEEIMTPEQMGYPLHLIGPDGEIERSFGADTREYVPNARLATRRLAATTAEGTIWTVPPGRYMLEHWDPASGERLDSFELAEPEVVPISSWPEDGSLRPPGVVESIWTDDAGRIFLLLRVADAAWTPRPDPDAEVAYTVEEYDAIYDWIIHVVDPKARQRIAELRHGSALWGRPGSDVLATLASDGDSDVIEYRLVRPRILDQ